MLNLLKLCEGCGAKPKNITELGDLMYVTGLDWEEAERLVKVLKVVDFTTTKTSDYHSHTVIIDV